VTGGSAPQVTAPPGTGFIVVPGGTPGVRQPATPAAVPGPQSDGSDFYGLGAALLIIVVAIFVVRRMVPLRRQPAEGPHPGPPPPQAGESGSPAP
jgi:hypothetical protein